jgi:hypothetical protein
MAWPAMDPASGQTSLDLLLMHGVHGQYDRRRMHTWAGGYPGCITGGAYPTP